MIAQEFDTHLGLRLQLGSDSLVAGRYHVEIYGETYKTRYINDEFLTPAVSPDGELSWTNNGSLENPAPVNIKGPKGDAGEAGTPGTPGAAGASIKAIELYTNETGGVSGGKATLTDNSEITITVTTAPAG